ncbi:AsmA family protein [Stakelama marina]|uniref:AsmA family protein n=1 Tax=Stakelama marina TaxID=2826939 RepID=A0A8T4IEF3_9SPHN|nr:AsmA family protein [Stakelama marina]MBR0553027.1 AsmA family protein [Stakelama marina]
MISAKQSRLARRIAIGVVAVVVLALLALAMFPWGALDGLVRDRLSERFRTRVALDSVERIGWFGFHPTVRIRGLRVAQPRWAGTGDMIRVEQADLRFAALPLLTGSFDPEALSLSGAKLALVRDGDGRKNWEAQSSSGGGSGNGIESLSIADSFLTYSDAKQDRSFALRLRADDSGVFATGKGHVRDAPVDVSAKGAPVTRDARWPFTVAIDGSALSMTIDGAMDHPLDTGHMNAEIDAKAANLRYVDAIIEAGLFGTQPVNLSARADHDGDIWKIIGLTGTIGRSRLSEGHATIVKDNGRSRIDGALDFATLDFNDLASDAGLAKAAAQHARTGPRILPDTRIDLKSVSDVDGSLDIRVAKLLFDDKTPFTALSGTLVLDHSRLHISPVVANLIRGTLSGPVVIDQRDRKAPQLSVDLTLKDSTIATFGGAGDFDAPLSGYAKLTGSGETIRAALGRSTGTVALVSSSGVLPAKLASFIGLDVGRGVFADKDKQARLRCLGMRLDVKNGLGTFDPLLIDTSRSQTRVVGGIRLSDEQIRAALYGAPKKDSILRLKKPITVSGTIRSPKAHAPEGAKSVGNILGMLGDAITGNQRPLADNVDCAALRGKVLAR